jgi:hypothetical protein
MPPRQYQGSLEERAQEAILIFQEGHDEQPALEDMILKVGVRGQADHFAWVVPFPQEPAVKKESAALFRELHLYVETRLARRSQAAHGAKAPAEVKAEDARPGVEVLSRQVVGSYDVAVVKENTAGALNDWLQKEGFRTLTDAEDVLGFYRRKKYVFACIKVADARLESQRTVDLHPLRFTFSTAGRDGIYFPMKMTGLQSEPFDVNLYVFYHAWINDHLSRFGYEHRGFHLRYRDWDTANCVPNGGKSYSAPDKDPLLRDLAYAIPTVTQLFQKVHPGETYYLTNIQANGLRPQEVRDWSDDLWLFPYYVNRQFVPYDVRDGGPASAAWLGETGTDEEAAGPDPQPAGLPDFWRGLLLGGTAVGLVVVVGVWLGRWRRPAPART